MLKPIRVIGASVFKSVTDREGETKLTVCIPKNQQVQAALVTALVEHSLTLDFTVESNSLLTKGRFVGMKAEGQS